MKEEDFDSRYTILVVEDDESLNRLIQKRLKKAGFRTEQALNGADAISFVRENPNTVLLLDYLLPDMTGVELIKTLAGQKCSVPFIVITGHGDEKVAVAMMKLGARDYLMKGMNFLDPLPQVVRQVLNTLTAEKKLAETEATLLKSEEKYRNLISNLTNVVIMELDSEGKFTYVSPQIFDVFGYTPEESLGLTAFDFVHPDDIGKCLEAMAAKDEVVNLKYRSRHKDGHYVYVSTTGKCIPDGRGGEKIISVARDITERKRAEEQIKASLKEKEVMLKEIHHRVKNNLQVISSLLSIQSRQVKDKEALELFEDSQTRIMSMSLIHEKLYLSEDMARIDFADYIRTLTGNLFHTFSVYNVKLNVDVKDVFLDVNTGIPCGLIINELVSNSLKHAFHDDRKGEIQVGLYKQKDGEFSLNVRDNGSGFPADRDFRNTESVGMQIVMALVEQLEGRIELDRGEGTSFTIRFRERK